MYKYLCKLTGFVLRHVEVFLCIRKTPYKTHRFPKKNARYEYYYNKEKYRQIYA